MIRVALLFSLVLVSEGARFSKLAGSVAKRQQRFAGEAPAGIGSVRVRPREDLGREPMSLVTSVLTVSDAPRERS